MMFKVTQRILLHKQLRVERVEKKKIMFDECFHSPQNKCNFNFLLFFGERRKSQEQLWQREESRESRRVVVQAI